MAALPGLGLVAGDRANQVVSADRLVEELWADAPPKAARNVLHSLVLRLRRRLRPADAHGTPLAPVLHTRPPGYLLAVPPGQIDRDRFEEFAAQGRAALLGGEADRAAGSLRAALELWRGAVALADVPRTATITAEAARLEADRTAALEQRIEGDLLLRRHGELIGELLALVAAHPLRERFHTQLMQALYRSGRQAEALEAYQAARRVLVEELGLEPGAALRRLQQAVLTGEASLEPGAEAVAVRALPARLHVPRQLPADIATFTGRAAELARLDRVLGAAGHDGPVVISAINGTGGIGKSALAIRAAYRLAAAFPDGQLYVDLQGAAGVAPMHPLEVLGRFLRALGVDGCDRLAAVDEAAARFRSQVAGRRLLVVLDNARDAAQVAPLLPASPGCAVLVTSRRVLASLDGACHVHLDVLSPQEAVALLGGRLAGQERIAADPEAARAVVGWCGYLPLAVRIAGARLAARPGWPVRALAERLGDERRRLDELELADRGIRVSLEVSLQELAGSADPIDRAAAAAFSLLGMPTGPDFGVPAAARLLNQPDPKAERLLERLVDARLLDAPTPDRYRLHDLLRLYARDRAAHDHPEHDQLAALGRAFGLYVATAWRTFALLRPGDRRLERADPRWAAAGLALADTAAALDWLEAERANLVAAAAQAARIPDLGAVAVELAHALFAFFQMRGRWDDWILVNQTALTVAGQAGNRSGQAQAHSDLGTAHMCQGRYPEAVDHHQQSLAAHRELGDRRGQAASLNNLGIVHERQGSYGQAVACLQESLTIRREIGDRHGQAVALTNLGGVHTQRGAHAYAKALACLRESLSITRELGDRPGQAINLNSLGTVHRRQGRYDEALAWLRESLTIARELGHAHGQAEALRELGVTLQALGHHEQARAHWREALAIFEQLRPADAEEVRTLLAGAGPRTRTRQDQRRRSTAPSTGRDRPPAPPPGQSVRARSADGWRAGTGSASSPLERGSVPTRARRPGRPWRGRRGA